MLAFALGPACIPASNHFGHSTRHLANWLPSSSGFRCVTSGHKYVPAVRVSTDENSQETSHFGGGTVAAAADTDVPGFLSKLPAGPDAGPKPRARINAASLAFLGDGVWEVRAKLRVEVPWVPSGTSEEALVSE
jgi:hypothetical protein